MMKKNPLHTIVSPKSIAIFGASNNSATMGTTHLANVIHNGYKGKVWPIHPKEKSIFGLPAYSSVAELPEPADLALLILRASLVPEVLEECGKKGIKHAIILSGGFMEAGKEGKEPQERLDSVARDYDIRYVGPNCIGVINSSLSLNMTFYSTKLFPGSMGFLSQSGTYVTQTTRYLTRRGIHYSSAISLGNEASIDLVDGIEYLGEDPETKAIALYIETIRRGRAFVEAAKRVSMKKPIVAYYVGGTEEGARAGLSHTGAMGGNDILHEGVFRQCGIIRAPSIGFLFDWAWALANTPRPKGRRVAIISPSGGPVASMADVCSRNTIEVPLLSEKTRKTITPFVPATATIANPVDLTFSRDPYVSAFKIPAAIFRSGEVDALLIHGVGDSIVTDRSGKESATSEIQQGLVSLKNQTACPILASTFDDHTDVSVDYVMKNDIPVYPTPERAARAMAAVMEYADWVRSNKK
ncbi:acetate--CoA ligase family protein [Thermodesulfobacteriota bacterium]